MSLDVYLTMPGQPQTYEARIFVREDGQTRNLTREEWAARFPDREPVTFTEEETDTVYSANITHNLNKMADEAGIYKALWRPEECGITVAAQLIEPLERGLALLQSDPSRFQAFNPDNGWGTYEGLVRFVQDYLVVARRYSDAEVSVSR